MDLESAMGEYEDMQKRRVNFPGESTMRMAMKLYADPDNWHIETDEHGQLYRVEWVGLGNGPELAIKALGEDDHV